MKTESVGRLKTPKKSRQVSYRFQLHQRQDPTRVRADIPQMARSWAIRISER